jgi:hypothetical protein
MIHIHLSDDAPIPRLAESIARQKSEGGRLVLYHRVWSALVVSMSQRRVEWVPASHSRVAPGIKHCLFSLFLGVWGVSLVAQVPLCLITNLRGGIDVTAELSDRPIDPFRPLSLDVGRAKQDQRAAQWTFIVLGLVAIPLVFYLCL